MTIPAWLSTNITYPNALERLVGELPVPSGKIVACDPLVFLAETSALQRSVPAGTYPVHVGLVDGDVAYARIDFGRSVQRWEPAALSANGEVLGYPVDAGLGCFVDAGVAAAGVDEELLEPVQAALKGGRSFALLPLAASKIAVFSSGEGDGVYASYWGLSADGQAAALVTEFIAPEESDADDAALDEGEADAPSDAAPPPGVSPYFEAARQLLRRLKAQELIETSKKFDEDAVAEALVEAWTLGSDVAETLMEQEGVEELYATDADLGPKR